MRELAKKLEQVEKDLDTNKKGLEQANKDLEEKEKLLTQVSLGPSIYKAESVNFRRNTKCYVKKVFIVIAYTSIPSFQRKYQFCGHLS